MCVVFVLCVCVCVCVHAVFVCVCVLYCVCACVCLCKGPLIVGPSVLLTALGFLKHLQFVYCCPGAAG